MNYLRRPWGATQRPWNKIVARDSFLGQTRTSPGRQQNATIHHRDIVLGDGQKPKGTMAQEAERETRKKIEQCDCPSAPTNNHFYANGIGVQKVSKISARPKQSYRCLFQALRSKTMSSAAALFASPSFDLLRKPSTCHVKRRKGERSLAVYELVKRARTAAAVEATERPPRTKFVKKVESTKNKQQTR